MKNLKSNIYLTFLSKILLYIILMLLLSFNVDAAIYYIDYAGGADSNNGTTNTTPFKHCPGDANADNPSTARSTILAAGDVVYFKKGVTYEGQITVATSGSLMDSGKNARITSGGVLSSIGQNFQTTVRAGDYVYIYNYEDDCNPSCGSGTVTQGGKYLDSVGLWKVLSVNSDTDLTLGTYAGNAYNGAAYAIDTMYYRVVRPIHLTSTTTWGTGDAVLDSSNVGTYFESTIIISGKNRIMISNLKFTSTKNPQGYPSQSGCIDFNLKAAIYGTYTSTHSDIHILNNTFLDVWSGVRVGGRAPYSVIKDNIVTNWGYYSLTMSGNWSLIENNTLDNGMYGLGAGYSSQSVFRHNAVHNTNKLAATNCGGHANGFFPIFGDTAPSYYAWLYGNLITNSVSAIPLTYSNNGTYGWHIFNNVIIGYHGVPAGSAPYGRPGSGSIGIQLLGAPYTKVYNNTLFSMNISNSVGFVVAIKVAKDTGTIASTNVILRNNIIYNTSAAYFNSVRIGSLATDDSPTGFSSEYNCFYTPNRTDNYQYKSDSVAAGKSFAYWQGTLGYDNAGGSISNNPLFVDAIGISYSELDLTLQSTSPCKYFGATLDRSIRAPSFISPPKNMRLD